MVAWVVIFKVINNYAGEELPVVFLSIGYHFNSIVKEFCLQWLGVAVSYPKG